MRKAWFCYEATSTGPAPVIHYDSMPNPKNVLNPKILQTHELNQDYFTVIELGFEPEDNYWILIDEVNCSFDKLVKDFPYTGDEYSKCETFSLDHKEAAE